LAAEHSDLLRRSLLLLKSQPRLIERLRAESRVQRSGHLRGRGLDEILSGDVLDVKIAPGEDTR
jgi:translation initiation factor IF-1